MLALFAARGDPHSPFLLPTFPPSESKDLCTLEKVPLFLFRLRAPDADPGADDDAAEYFMRGISRDESAEDHMELLPSPLQCSVKVKIPGSDPTLMKMLDCQIQSLGHQYKMIGKKLNGVAFLPLDKEEEGKRGEFVVLLAYSNALMVLTSAEMRWKPLENVPDTYCSGIVTCRGKFYATFLSQEIFVIDPYSLEATLKLASPHQPGIRNCLVPSGNNELFLVEVKIPTSGVLQFTRLACKVSRLDEEAGK